MNDCLLLSAQCSRGENGRFGTFFLSAVSLDNIIPVLLWFSNSAGTCNTGVRWRRKQDESVSTKDKGRDPAKKSGEKEEARKF
jgi:hypothetical protein